MASRREVLERIAQLAGPNVLRLEDAADGWPGYGDIFVEGAARQVALYVGPLGLSHRGRDHVERRFQNPGSDRPIADARPDRIPMLLGLWEADPIVAVPRALLVSADPYRRVGRSTRFSVFADIAALSVGLKTGWARDENALGEQILCFYPELLSLSVEAAHEDAVPDPNRVRAAVSGSGLLEAASAEEAEEAAKRARRAATALVRSAGFGRRVVKAYDGRCAMCGLGLGFPEGAHIYPVSAPNSTDRLSNGLALCPNHHDGFDRHRIRVEPSSGAIFIHNEITLAAAASDAAARHLVDATLPALRQPALVAARPDTQMFARRYAFYGSKYDWQ